MTSPGWENLVVHMHCSLSSRTARTTHGLSVALGGVTAEIKETWAFACLSNFTLNELQEIMNLTSFLKTHSGRNNVIILRTISFSLMWYSCYKMRAFPFLPTELWSVLCILQIHGWLSESWKEPQQCMFTAGYNQSCLPLAIRLWETS